MKRLLFIFPFVILSKHSGFSQTLTAQDCNPVVGDLLTTSMIHLTTNQFAKGTGIVWDLHKLETPPPGWTDTIVPASSISTSSSYPGCNIVRTGPVKRFLNANTTSLDLIGSAGSKYTGSRRMLAYPLFYGKTWTDRYRENYFNSNDRVGGLASYTVSGSGTLITPLDTFYNCLMISQVNLDTVYLNGSYNSDYRDVITSWYVSGYHDFLLSSVERPYWSFGDKLPYFLIASDAHIITSQKDLVAKDPIEVFPNPSNEMILITGAGRSKLFIKDIRGRVLTELYLVSDHEKIDASSLDPGIYVLEVDRPGGSYIKKILIHK